MDVVVDGSGRWLTRSMEKEIIGAKSEESNGKR